MKKLSFFAWFILVCAGARAASTCHAVSVSGAGSKTGADWNNSFEFSSLSLVRGHIYYLADGTYPAILINTADSGTTTIEFRKAQSYDYGAGANCTSSIGAGWNTSTMGSSQANFQYVSSVPIINIGTDYITLNGNGTSTAPGCGGAPGATVTASPPTPSDCGIKVDNSTCTNASTSACNAPINIAAGYNHETLEYIELRGNASEIPPADDNVSDETEVATYGPNSGNHDQTFTHIFGHDSQCVYIQYAVLNHNASYNYWWGTEVNGGTTCHGQYSYVYGSGMAGGENNGTENHSIFRDITGTGIFTFGIGGTADAWTYYDNVYWNSSTFVPGVLTLGTTTNGVVACLSGMVCNGFLFYQNTSINRGSNSGIDFSACTSGCSITMQNNLWYKSTQGTTTPAPPLFITSGGVSLTQDHNSFLYSGASCPSGTANVCDNISTSPFTNWQNGVFTLTSDSSDWNNRLSLSSPYNTDLVGVTFTTDRGAYQYQASGSTGSTLSVDSMNGTTVN
jgi:hypothetical protein